MSHRMLAHPLWGYRDARCRSVGASHTVSHLDSTAVGFLLAVQSIPCVVRLDRGIEWV